MLDFTLLGWITVIICAMMVGFSKTGISGAGILVVPVLALIMPAKHSTGFLLPLLCMADIIAILYWRRHADWPRLLRLMPWATVGVVAGYFILKIVTKEQLMPIIGVLILLFIGVTIWNSARGDIKNSMPTTWWFGALMGLLAGSTSMMANAAGPVMAIYLLAMGMDKKEFIGTTAFFFWIMNLTKIPFSWNLDLITKESFITDLAMLPCIIIGGILGIILVHRINQAIFNKLIMALAAISAFSLCVRSLFFS
ncbi:MAG: sulfite exporter TauE/SafE family protein [Phycisphaerae bacterium]|nr:sulfite exporter TauE/SafE family protein [Phycisphaerae bacterium]